MKVGTLLFAMNLSLVPLVSQPLVQVVHPVGPLVIQADGSTSFTFEALPQGAVLDRALTRIDDSLVLFSDLSTSDRVVRTVQLKLPKTAKAVTIQVFDMTGKSALVNVPVSGVQQTEEHTKKEPDRPGRVFLLAVGISRYQNPALELTYADKDAQSLAELYRLNPGQGPEVRTRLLLNEQATRTAILDARSNFLDDAGPQDLVIIFLAGHGVSIREQFYFLTWGTNPMRPYAEGISSDELKTILLSGLTMRQGLVLIDACLSGSATKSGLQTDQQRIRRDLVSRLGEGSALYFLSSSSSNEPSIEEQKWGHGLLTQALLTGLGTKLPADTNRDGRVRLIELDSWLRSEIPRLSSGRQTPEGAQMGAWPGGLSLYGW